jgi:hypothetical protein
VRGLETAAALAIIDFGVLLLTGGRVNYECSFTCDRGPSTLAYALAGFFTKS